LFGLTGNKYIEVKGSVKATKDGLKDLTSSKSKILNQLIAEIDTNNPSTDLEKKIIAKATKNSSTSVGMANGGQAYAPNAMLMPGEYVYSTKDAQSIGYGKLDRLNKLPKFAKGGSFRRGGSSSRGLRLPRFANGGGFKPPAYQQSLIGRPSLGSNSESSIQTMALLSTSILANSLILWEILRNILLNN
jgi:hypothetical protein